MRIRGTKRSQSSKHLRTDTMIKGPYLGTFGAHFFQMFCVLGDAEYAQATTQLAESSLRIDA